MRFHANVKVQQRNYEHVMGFNEEKNYIEMTVTWIEMNHKQL